MLTRGHVLEESQGVALVLFCKTCIKILGFNLCLN